MEERGEKGKKGPACTISQQSQADNHESKVIRKGHGEEPTQGHLERKGCERYEKNTQEGRKACPLFHCSTLEKHELESFDSLTHTPR